MAKCGELTEDEKTVKSSFVAFEAAKMTYAMMQDPTIPKSDDFGFNIDELIEGAQLAISMEKAGVLEQYRNKFNEMEDCRQKVKDEHAISFHHTAKLNVENVIDFFNGQFNPENWKEK